ncbi:hypothetical protein ABZ646_10720 [Streptomyces sp. NPDC007162]
MSARTRRSRGRTVIAREVTRAGDAALLIGFGAGLNCAGQVVLLP